MNLEDLLAEREIYRKLVCFAYAMDERQWRMCRRIKENRGNVGSLEVVNNVI